MNTKSILNLIVLTFISFSISAQEMTQDGSHFLVNFENVSPPVRDMIMAFEGQPAEQFMANDITGKEHYLGNYKGKKVILWFWSMEDDISLGHISALNATIQNNGNVVVLSFARGLKSKVAPFVANMDIQFPVIPNADVFGQMAYGADLGYPRYFFIDEYGIIRQVYPEGTFGVGENPYNAINDILSKI